MKSFFTFLILIAAQLLPPLESWGQWQKVAAILTQRQAPLPVHYSVFSTSEDALKTQLFRLSATPQDGQTIQLPLPDGSLRYFRVWRSSLLPARLAARYPELATFTAEAIDNASVTAKLDYTDFGFHAMIFDGGNVSFVDPVDNSHTGQYIAHYKRDEVRYPDKRSVCLVPGQASTATHKAQAQRMEGKTARTVNGDTLRTYRLALACDHEYAQAATGLPSPTIAQVLSKMLTTLNRVNGVYERELAITMVLADNEDTLIFPLATGSVNGDDPYNGIDSNAGACININQAVCDARIGSAGYDVGHVFTTGAGGLSEVGVACYDGYKASSVSGQPDPAGDGFDIDYVSHEIGHEYGGEHPFNDAADGSCAGGNMYAPSAYEPGSGSTIMAYAGICAPDNLQPHSDAYFHSRSLEEIQQYITTGGDVCPVKTATNNKQLQLPSFMTSYVIPYLTPFELTAPVYSDTESGAQVTYCWEQVNLGTGSDAGQTFANTHGTGPIFRSYYPATSPTRVFPENSMVLAGILSNAGINDAEGEKAPDVARYLTFRLTLRNVYQGTGSFLIPDDTVHLDVIQEDTGFYVTSQSDPNVVYMGGSTQQITWHVAGTNASPVNTANVDIYMSVDSGNTWPYYIGTFLNNGSASLTIPNPDTVVTSARIKVKGSGNVFFNVSRYPFTVTPGSASDTDVVLYPSPAHSTVRISSGNKGLLSASAFDAVGREVWKSNLNGEMDVDVSAWPRGMYIMRFVSGRQSVVKKFVVN